MKNFFVATLICCTSTAYANFSEWKNCTEVSSKLSEADRQSFYESLKTALKKIDVAALSKLAIYPLRLKVDGKKTLVKTEKDFLAVAPKIFNQDFVNEILAEKSDNDVCNWQGLGIANGSIWIRSENFGKPTETLKIVTINNK